MMNRSEIAMQFWSAATCRRFKTADVPAHSKAAASQITPLYGSFGIPSSFVLRHYYGIEE